MAWAKVDDGWWCHPKVMGLSLPARGLWVSALSWSCAQRRDVVPATFLAMVGASQEHADELTEVGLWVPDDAGFRIHDWSEYQEMTTSEKRAEAGRKGGLTTGSSKVRTGASQANRKQTASNGTSKPQAKAQAGTHPIPTHPYPTDSRVEPEDGSDATAMRSHPAKRGTRAPDLMPVSDAMRRWAADNGVRHDALAGETEAFLDYHRAKGTVHKDWNAAWRNWMRNAKGYRPQILATTATDDLGPQETYR